MTTNRPPSCDLPPEFYQTKLKECFACCSTSIDNKFSRFYVCSECGAEAHKADWNSIPRRSELVELLWRVHNVLDDPSPIMLRHLGKYVSKLRKEMGE
jgi:hypothetical protein